MITQRAQSVSSSPSSLPSPSEVGYIHRSGPSQEPGLHGGTKHTHSHRAQRDFISGGLAIETCPVSHKKEMGTRRHDEGVACRCILVKLPCFWVLFSTPRRRQYVRIFALLVSMATAMMHQGTTYIDHGAKPGQNDGCEHVTLTRAWKLYGLMIDDG